MKDAFPEIDAVHMHLSDDAASARLDIVAGTTTTQFELSQAKLQYLVAKLQLLAAHWETRRRQIDPTAGKQNDTVPMTAIRPSEVQVAGIPGSNGGAVIFGTAAGPQAFALAHDDMTLLAMRLLRQAEHVTKEPTRN